MLLENYKKQLRNPLRQRTLVFLLDDDKVLLGLKKKGFGAGKLLGIGGKVEEGEGVEDGAMREMREETGLVLLNLTRMAIIDFYFPHITDESWNQQVYAFTTRDWNGEPRETEEISPKWYPIHAVPFNLMWDDAQYWLPKVLRGENLAGEFVLNEELRVIVHKVTDDRSAFLLK